MKQTNAIGYCFRISVVLVDKNSPDRRVFALATRRLLPGCQCPLCAAIPRDEKWLERHPWAAPSLHRQFFSMSRFRSWHRWAVCLRILWSCLPGRPADPPRGSRCAALDWSSPCAARTSAPPIRVQSDPVTARASCRRLEVAERQNWHLQRKQRDLYWFRVSRIIHKDIFTD